MTAGKMSPRAPTVLAVCKDPGMTAAQIRQLFFRISIDLGPKLFRRLCWFEAACVAME
jgi:hypothetical protein